jgi:hypothetical protein
MGWYFVCHYKIYIVYISQYLKYFIIFPVFTIFCVISMTLSLQKKINLRYLPKRLSLIDKKKQASMLMLSKKQYKLGKYYTRKHVKSFKSKTSSHIINAKNLYGVETIGATDELAKKTGCSKSSLEKVIRKGEGAYYSSGSRPNQTPQSWGVARLASALTSGKAGAVDYNILHEGCKKGSKGYKAAELARKRHGYVTRKVPKVSI